MSTCRLHLHNMPILQTLAAQMGSTPRNEVVTSTDVHEFVMSTVSVDGSGHRWTMLLLLLLLSIRVIFGNCSIPLKQRIDSNNNKKNHNSHSHNNYEFKNQTSQFFPFVFPPRFSPIRAPHLLCQRRQRPLHVSHRLVCLSDLVAQQTHLRLKDGRISPRKVGILCDF